MAGTHSIRLRIDAECNLTADFALPESSLVAECNFCRSMEKARASRVTAKSKGFEKRTDLEKQKTLEKQSASRRSALKTILLGSLTGAMLSGTKAHSDEQPEMVAEPSADDDNIVELLFVQEADAAELHTDSLTLRNVKPLTLFFADRPEDIAGYLTYQEYVDLVYTGLDNFEEEPPNATLMILDGDALIPVVMELSAKPEIIDADMVYPKVKIINGEPPESGKTAVLFIDTVGRPMSPGSVASVHRRHRRHRRRRVHRAN